jgi:segregation and condensation protein B
VTGLARIVEALLFAASSPLKAEQIREVEPAASDAEIEAAFAELGRFYDETERGFHLAHIGDGHQLLTRPALAPWVERFLVGHRRQRLSRAALEVLAVIAYRQPVTRGEIESVRGVDCGATLRTLLERKLTMIKGRARAVGHPLLYATTDRFFEHFGIGSLSELPKLEEFAALVDREAAREDLRRSGMLPEPVATVAVSGASEAEPAVSEPADAGDAVDAIYAEDAGSTGSFADEDPLDSSEISRLAR